MSPSALSKSLSFKDVEQTKIDPLLHGALNRAENEPISGAVTLQDILLSSNRPPISLSTAPFDVVWIDCEQTPDPESAFLQVVGQFQRLNRARIRAQNQLNFPSFISPLSQLNSPHQQSGYKQGGIIIGSIASAGSLGAKLINSPLHQSGRLNNIAASMLRYYAPRALPVLFVILHLDGYFVRDPAQFLLYTLLDFTQSFRPGAALVATMKENILPRFELRVQSRFSGRTLRGFGGKSFEDLFAHVQSQSMACFVNGFQKWSTHENQINSENVKIMAEEIMKHCPCVACAVQRYKIQQMKQEKLNATKSLIKQGKMDLNDQIKFEDEMKNEEKQKKKTIEQFGSLLFQAKMALINVRRYNESVMKLFSNLKFKSHCREIFSKTGSISHIQSLIASSILHLMQRIKANITNVTTINHPQSIISYNQDVKPLIAGEQLGNETDFSLQTLSSTISLVQFAVLVTLFRMENESASAKTASDTAGMRPRSVELLWEHFSDPTQIQQHRESGITQEQFIRAFSGLVDIGLIRIGECITKTRQIFAIKGRELQQEDDFQAAYFQTSNTNPSQSSSSLGSDDSKQSKDNIITNDKHYMDSAKVGKGKKTDVEKHLNQRNITPSNSDSGFGSGSIFIQPARLTCNDFGQLKQILSDTECTKNYPKSLITWALSTQ
ncbi:MAG: hypothetical protein EZS28_012900 [Streblomastix strix]|uniref:Uncharacterized protein n=1 Tax=Streblomastix strix TaxID=222440 RepID=A0A5J4WAA0_9EUKA|nr:MAG: hypothetical protein EZS28_012900 [Streblomastix strix]